jgi:uncharacterized membrane protein YphA (DoxX/SURF4 family)
VSWLTATASVVVGLAFLVAGASKLAAGPAWPASARDLGVPGWIALLVPWVELVVGGLLVAQLAEPWPALAATAMLVVFTALLITGLRAGERPVCACFGRWSASPIGAGHLARNGVLIVLAVVAVLG